MNRASQIVILCEDKAHELFARRFLTKGWNVKHRTIRVPPYPRGKGSGKEFVKNNLLQEVEALRGRQAATILVVIQDADALTVERVRSNLDAILRPPRTDNEPIVYITPKWHVQTWIAYLDGKIVDEQNETTYKYGYSEISESKAAHPFIDGLAEKCRKKIQLESPPDSLTAACMEFDRIRDALRAAT